MINIVRHCRLLVTESCRCLQLHYRQRDCSVPIAARSASFGYQRLWLSAMPAHSTCDDALASVAAFSAAVKDRDTINKRKEKVRKEKHKQKEKGKDKHKHKGHKRRGSRGKGEARLSDSDSCDLSCQGTLEDQLMRSREAVRATRELLSQHPDVRADLREVSHIALPACNEAKVCLLAPR